MARPVTGTLRSLLASVIDYAGLFPPADLSLRQATANYSEYRDGDHAWMLGSFVAPAANLCELAGLVPRHQQPWPVSVLVGPNLDEDLDAVARFAQTEAGAVQWIEVKAAAAGLIGSTRERVPQRVGIYFEIAGPGLLPAVADAGCRAKLRTGGTAPDAIPNAGAVARFIHAAVSQQVAFKCTAGLHHAIRAEHRLTYREDSPRAVMHGFLNLLLAAAFAQAGVALETLVRVIEEESPGAFRFAEDRVTWRDLTVTRSDIEMARRAAFLSFGSCSFVEPAGELQSLGLL